MTSSWAPEEFCCFARHGSSDEASRSLVLVGVCGGDSALWGYGRKPPLTHILPHYHVTWRTPAAPPLGDAFDLAHPPLPVLRTGAARRLLKALCTFWEGCCCCRLRATGNAITPSPRDGGSYRVALQQYKSFWQDSTLDLCHFRAHPCLAVILATALPVLHVLVLPSGA